MKLRKKSKPTERDKTPASSIAQITNEEKTAGQARQALPFPSLPFSDATAAGLIALLFAATGILITLRTVKPEKTPKSKKPKGSAASAAH